MLNLVTFFELIQSLKLRATRLEKTRHQAKRNTTYKQISINEGTESHYQ